MENKLFFIISFFIFSITVVLSFFDVNHSFFYKNKNCLQKNDLIFKIHKVENSSFPEFIFVNSISEANGLIRNNKVYNIDNICEY